MPSYKTIQKADPDIYAALQDEAKRQFTGLELIASENYVSEAVMEAMGSILTNKYSEGYANKRYYGGNQYIDVIEEIAIKRAQKLFGAKFVNVQPYSGSPANLAVHFALLKPGDRTMGMALSSGGHLTHGFKVSISGSYYDNVSYEVNEEGYIDLDEVRKLALKHKPKLIWVGASAYPRIIDYKGFRDIADEVGAYLVTDMAHIAGLVVADEHPSPLRYAHIVTTTTHKTLRGPRGAMILTNYEELAQKIDKAVFPGLQGGPHNHITAGIAIALKEADTHEFKEYAHQVVRNAKTLADELMKRDWKIITNGTDNHLLLMDVTANGIDGLAGKAASEALERANISVNKNAIPHDPRKPWDPSGIRLGTPSLTTRGMKEEEMKTVAEFIDKALKNFNNRDMLDKIKMDVKTFTRDFPIPGIPASLLE